MPLVAISNHDEAHVQEETDLVEMIGGLERDRSVVCGGVGRLRLGCSAAS